jgi:hypothetical protein
MRNLGDIWFFLGLSGFAGLKKVRFNEITRFRHVGGWEYLQKSRIFKIGGNWCGSPSPLRGEGEPKARILRSPAIKKRKDQEERQSPI